MILGPRPSWRSLTLVDDAGAWFLLAVFTPGCRGSWRPSTWWYGRGFWRHPAGWRLDLGVLSLAFSWVDRPGGRGRQAPVLRLAPA